jgi:hypothetical protein
MGTRERFGAVLALILLVAPGLCDAAFRCTAEDGRVWWQQDSPDCKLPSDPRDSSFADPNPNVRRRPSLPRATPVAGVPAPAGTAVLYTQEVALLEAQYPALNPDSPKYDRALVKAVMTAKAVRVRAGFRPDIAVQEAVREVMEAGRQPSQATNPPVWQPSPKAQGTDAVIDASKEGAAKGAVIAIVLLGASAALALLRWLFGGSRAVASRAARVIGSTSSEGVARAAGAVSVKVERKTASIRDAFKQGRRDAEKRGEEA